jgi:prepilin-type N-terminal cleavage/methylation domain-containing protein
MRRRAERGKEKRARDAGFTLLEVLVTLVVFGILLEVLAQGLHVGLRGWTVAQEIGAGTATLETTDLALRELLERASPADPLTYDLHDYLAQATGRNGAARGRCQRGQRRTTLGVELAPTSCPLD